MAYTTINKSTDYFNTKLYTGNSTGSTTQAITGVGFQPDWVWLKSRTTAERHWLVDAVRGITNGICSHTTEAQFSNISMVSFDNDGFTVGTDAYSINKNNDNYASWNWKANGTGSSNTDGSITSTVSANTTAGFSIVKYTGNNTAGATVGHGLGAVPKMIIFKELGGTNGWHIYHHSIGNNAVQVLDQNASNYSPNNFLNSTNPTSSIFTLGQNGGSNATTGMIAYCFAEKQGYSKFGSYTGLGGTNYPFIYTGFKPAFVMAKRTNDTSNWVMYDNKRQYNLIEGQYNPQRPRLASNLNSAESSFTSDNGVDLLSNGFVVRDNSNDAYTINISGSTYIYMAFGQSLVGSNNVPCTAR